jgi:hypothetical protein
LKIKSRKIFAILAITMMLLTLLPATALAYSATASLVETDKASTPAGTDILFTIYFRNAAGAPVANTAVNFALVSDMDTLGGAFTAAFGGGAIAAGTLAARDAAAGTAGALLTATTDAAGMVQFNLRSAVAGSSTVNVFNTNVTATRLLVGSAPVTYTAGAATGVSIARRDALGPNVEVGREVDFRATVVSGTSPAAGVTVTFEEREGGGAWRSIGSAVSGANGFADLKYTRTASSAGAAVEYRASIPGFVSPVTTITWVAGGALTITGPDSANVARNQAVNMDVWVNDAHGNRRGAQAVDFSLTRPAGSVATFVGGTTTVTVNTDNVAGATFGRARATFTPDVVGEYRVRATVAATGISVTTVYTAVEIGAVTRMELRFPRDRFAMMTRPATATPIAADVPAGAVLAPLPTFAGSGTLVDLEAWVFDAAGVGRRATGGELTAATSNSALGGVSIVGDAIRVSNPAGTGRGLVTITAVHPASGQVATLRVPIVGGGLGILETVTVDGLKASVALQLVDADVNPTFRTTAPAATVQPGAVGAQRPSVDVGAALAFTVVAPAGVTVARQTSFVGGTGRGSLELTAAAPGEYTITVATTAAPWVSRTFTVEFAAPAVPAPGAQSVTMFIGARGFVQDGVGKTMDAAPFIENQRTFVPVRFLAEAFGATADWVPKDAPVRTVTLTRADLTITINIGSPAITVVKGGVTSTVTADVAAFIRNGRTVLPFRAIAEAFGAEVDYGPKDAPIEWVSFKQ